MPNLQTETVAGITYSKPTVVLLQETGIGTPEVAARTCYDSFSASENNHVKWLNDDLSFKPYDGSPITYLPDLNNIPHSDLLDKLAWTHFHHSVLEHANLTYLIKGTSRGVLQEHSRHRIQSISVKSTRYTMQSVLHAFNACSNTSLNSAKFNFTELVKPMHMFVVNGVFETIEIRQLFDKLKLQKLTIGDDEFHKRTLGKKALGVLNSMNCEEYTSSEVFKALSECPSKRNVGDSFKWVVTDNWKVDMVVTFNLRSLKNYLTLRDSGAAYFQIRWLAQAMKEATPSKYLDLIIKKD